MEQLVTDMKLYVIAAAAAAAAAAAPPPSALIVYHRYAGTITLAADITQFQYADGHMYVEMADLGEDGIFHTGFETP